MLPVVRSVGEERGSTGQPTTGARRMDRPLNGVFRREGNGPGENNFSR